MGLPTFLIDDPPEDVLDEHVHTRTTLAADPLAAPLVATIDPLIDDWKEVHALRLQLVIDVAQAVAKAFFADAQLNVIVDRLVPTLEKLVGRRAKGDPLWTVLLGSLEPAQLKRPILSDQLQTMLVWPDPLAESGHVELVQIGADLTPLLPVATAAEQAIATARQALTTFDTLGRWRKHIDLANAARAAAYGALLEIPHKNPSARLPADYADLFFLHDTSRRGANRPRKSAEIDKELKGLLVKVDSLKESLKEAVAREEAAAKAKAEREAKEKELALLKQQEKETKEKKKELEKELAKKK